MSISPYSSFTNSPFYNTSSMIDAVLYDSGHSSPAAEGVKRIRVLNSINNRYAFIAARQDWRWLFANKDFAVYEPYIEGAAVVTSGSTNVTGVGTLWNANAAVNNYFCIPGSNKVYRIAEVVSNTQLTLESVYDEESATNSNYEILKSTYALPSDADKIREITIDMGGRLIPCTPEEFFYRKQMSPGLTGSPCYYTVLNAAPASSIQLLEVFPAPDKAYTLKLSYSVICQKLTDSVSSYPLIPDKYRVALFYGALSDLYNSMSLADKAARSEAMFTNVLLTMEKDARVPGDRVRLTPSRHYRQRSFQRYRRGITNASDFGRDD